MLNNVIFNTSSEAFNMFKPYALKRALMATSWPSACLACHPLP